MTTNVDRFVDRLQTFAHMPQVFNPWGQHDVEHDHSTKSRDDRAAQLHRYLTERVESAKLVCLAEAPGFSGAKFSGIAMCSERILLNHRADIGVFAESVIAGGGVRTSRQDGAFGPYGANEPTATIVWGKLLSTGLDSRDFVLWNAFAFHPQKGHALTNRQPTPAELNTALPLLEEFVALFPNARRVAIGRVSESVLAERGIATIGQVRHPANGGATLFREGVERFVGLGSSPA